MSEGTPVPNPSRAREQAARGSHGTFSVPWAFGRGLLFVKEQWNP